ncbi:hypothetical protein CFP56_017966 [Quercus suber]|uniref:Uncharacterized protein n=1 Tax=Quercus suber TaxID=58331 RepID=A0AAW0KK47_QUESU
MNLPKSGKRLVGGVKRSRVSMDLLPTKAFGHMPVFIYYYYLCKDDWQRSLSQTFRTRPWIPRFVPKHIQPNFQSFYVHY